MLDVFSELVGLLLCFFGFGLMGIIALLAFPVVAVLGTTVCIIVAPIQIGSAYRRAPGSRRERLRYALKYF